jgi:hypothetical protein
VKNMVRKSIISEVLMSKPQPFRDLAVEAQGLGISSTPLRIPSAVLNELAELAKAKGISRNQLLLAFIDAGLRLEGRPSIEELAPGTTGWVRGERRWRRA